MDDVTPGEFPSRDNQQNEAGMKCPACAVGNAADASACVACGTPFASGVERVRAQLKKWQERLLDLTRANPLLGINRSRVSKLRLTVPEAHTLLGDLLRDGAKLRMPRVVKGALSPSGDSGEEEGGETQYQVDPGDVAFEAKPADLLRRLRRIHDNARTSVEERGVTTLHMSFGILKWGIRCSGSQAVRYGSFRASWRTGVRTPRCSSLAWTRRCSSILPSNSTSASVTG